MDYLARALKLAKKSHPSPNPGVGCVIIKDDKIIGQGYHKKAGEAHAEAVAIQDANTRSGWQNKSDMLLQPNLVKRKAQDLAGSIMYVTLEPCSHEEKRTLPCTQAIIEHRIKKVVVGCEDQNPQVKGIEALREAGIEVELVNDPDCRELNEAFFHWVKTKRPFVLLKLAMTLDGRIATKTGDSKYISNPQSRSIGYAWRALYDAILVGLNTVVIDNPRLTSRTPGAPNPIRIVVDGKLQLPLTSRVLEANARRIVATTPKHDKEKKKQLEALGVDVLVLPEEEPGHVDLNALLTELGSQGVTSVIVEGGSEVATDFFKAKLINKGAFFIAAKILGEGKTAFAGGGVEKMDQAWQLKNLSIRKVGNDVLIIGYF
ncbi:MAG TPA: bifunctional diaminohydroxyphosphoribosylaminopyrimidine deaminase/5-amino-6-(5-phosphoribosylamino)uracil reductase RibD [Candidatus Bilamarchaeaceae archaeon]|nr:bifunctional diaminohydroxyphosphoribosylaminopyrimidine deaminase/5-amino-6-(5-phosphoribosylamino)uracil reductase RibD [Candidatus Bilamarchaeaceae archaeon]